jgi:hypothetical protein
MDLTINIVVFVFGESEQILLIDDSLPLLCIPQSRCGHKYKGNLRRKAFNLVYSYLERKNKKSPTLAGIVDVGEDAVFYVYTTSVSKKFRRGTNPYEYIEKQKGGPFQVELLRRYLHGELKTEQVPPKSFEG